MKTQVSTSYIHHMQNRTITPHSPGIASYTRAVSPSGQPGTQKFSSCMGQQNLHSITFSIP